MRINILYFLDSLLDASITLAPHDAPYPTLISRDVGVVVGYVVPDTREGVLNLKSARQVSSAADHRSLSHTLFYPVIDGIKA